MSSQIWYSPCVIRLAVSKEYSLNDLIKISLEAVSAVFPWSISSPFSASCSSPSRLQLHHVSISTPRALYGCTQAALSWFRHLPSVPSFHRRRHRCSRECFRGFFGQQINRPYNHLLPSTRASLCLRVYCVL